MHKCIVNCSYCQPTNMIMIFKVQQLLQQVVCLSPCKPGCRQTNLNESRGSKTTPKWKIPTDFRASYELSYNMLLVGKRAGMWQYVVITRLSCILTRSHMSKGTHLIHCHRMCDFLFDDLSKILHKWWAVNGGFKLYKDILKIS